MDVMGQWEHKLDGKQQLTSVIAHEKKRAHKKEVKKEKNLQQIRITSSTNKNYH